MILAILFVALAGLLLWLLPKPPHRAATLGLVIFAVGLLFSVANLTGQHVLFR